MKTILPILISVPHGGDKTPPELQDRTALSPKDIFEDGDAFTRDIYQFKGKVEAFVEANIGRAFVDLNRAPTDRPPQNPDGVVKSHTVYEVPVYQEGKYPDDELIEEILEKYYYPYHAKLDECQNQPHVKFAFDCHSMLAQAPVISATPGESRPLICLSNLDDGKSNTSCSSLQIQTLANCFRETFEVKKEEIQINNPFKGGYITRSHYNGSIPWVQIELNRKLYLTPPYFDLNTMNCSTERLSEIREKIWQALQRFCTILL